jgi:hypothetical protein
MTTRLRATMAKILLLLLRMILLFDGWVGAAPVDDPVVKDKDVAPTKPRCCKGAPGP